VFSDGERDLASLQRALLETAGLEPFVPALAVLAAGSVTAGVSCGTALRHGPPRS
jgi:hypothetical protein